MNGDRRDFLTLVALLSGAPDPRSGVHGTNRKARVDSKRLTAVYDQILREPSLDELPDPDDSATFAITDAGAWESPDGTDEWQPISLPATELAARDGDTVLVSDDVDFQEQSLSRADTLQAEEVQTPRYTQFVDSQSPAHAIVDRPLATANPIELYVDPDGDDENRGSEEAPLATLQEALNRLPFILQHEVRISLADGTYDSHTDGVHTVPHVVRNLQSRDLDQEESFYIIGDSETPSNVHFTDISKFNFSFIGTAIHRTKLEGVELDCSIANYGGRMTVENCIINGNGDDVSGISGYQSHTRVVNCTFTDGLDYAVGPTNMGQVFVYNCNGHVGRYVYDPHSGGQVIDANNEITAPLGVYETDTMETGGAYQRSAGVIPTENAVLCDDFGDGRLRDRRISTTATYRPQWRVRDGDEPTVENGYLAFEEGSEVRIEIDRDVNDRLILTTGEWTFDYRFEFANDTDGEMTIQLASSNDAPRELRLGSDRLAVQKRLPNDMEDVIAESVDPDTDRHSVSIERTESDEWRLSRDGEQLALDTDSFVPDADASTPFAVRADGFDGDERAELHNIAFYNR